MRLFGCVRICPASILTAVSALLSWIIPILSQEQDDNLLRIIIFYHSNVFTRREFNAAANRFINEIRRDPEGQYTMKETYSVSLRSSAIMQPLDKYSPPEILDGLCGQLLEKRVTTLVYVSDATYTPQKTASAQYLLKMANFLGIPIIAWIGDNSGIVQVGTSCCVRLLFNLHSNPIYEPIYGTFLTTLFIQCSHIDPYTVFCHRETYNVFKCGTV